MVRPSSSKSKKHEDKNVERTRLKTLAIRKNIISETPATKGFTPLSPTNQVIKHHGKDILRKSSQRKNRFLFSFPGLMAPIGGGKIGELKNLGTQNPVLYLDFPQGQMKLFGTIVYPENKYLTLQFSRGGKNVMCEDYFDNMIVFSDAWWIGKKDENPDEARLDFPKELSEGPHLEYDFKGGVGAASVNKQGVAKSGMKDLKEQSPEFDSDDEISDVEKKLKEKMEVTPVRHSERTAGKRFKYADVSSEDDPAGSYADISESEEKKVDVSTSKHTVGKTSDPSSVVLDINNEHAEKENDVSRKNQSYIKPVTKSKKKSNSAVALTESKKCSLSNHGSLVQATISTLFKKVEEKVKVPRRKGKEIKEELTGTESTPKNKKHEVDDDIEEFSSSSQDTNGSDGDWAAF